MSSWQSAANLRGKNDVVFDEVQFWSSGILVCIIGGFGLIGKHAVFDSVAKPPEKTSLFFKLLSTLAVVDTMFILTAGAFMTNGAFR